MIVAMLNQLLESKIEGLTWREVTPAVTPAPEPCRKHEKYKAVIEPRKETKTGKPCFYCQAIWEHAQLKLPFAAKKYEPVFTANELQLGDEVMQEVVRQVYKFPDELKEEDPDKSFLSPSKAGGCIMRAFLDKTGNVGEPLSVRSKLTFIFGTLLEATYRYLLRTVKLDKVEFIEAPEKFYFDIGGEKNRGYVDGLLRAHWTVLQNMLGGDEQWWKDLTAKLGKESFVVVWEMKSKSDYGFKSLERTGRMDNEYGYRTQMGFYIKDLYAQKVIDIPVGIWFIVNKNTGHVLELPVTVKQLQDDIDLGHENYKLLRDIVDNNKKPPARPYELDGDGNIPNFPCGYCEQKHNCWADEPVIRYDRIDGLDQVRWEPVYKSEPTVWLDLQVVKGKPKFKQVESAAPGMPKFKQVEKGGEGDAKY